MSYQYPAAGSEPSYWNTGGKLPGYVDARTVIENSIGALASTERLSVSECAEKYRRIQSSSFNGPWDNEFGAALVEPMNASQSRRYTELIFAGPARSQKTSGLCENIAVHRIMTDPCVIHMTQMTRDAARKYSKENFDSMVRASPLIRKQLANKGEKIGNLFDKDWINGTQLTIGWPVGDQVASRTIPLTMSLDYDQFPTDVDGQGGFFGIQSKRGQTAYSRAMSIAESSPRFEIQEPEWTPDTIHAAPPCEGILALYNGGTRARYYWKCPACTHEFEPDVEHFHYDQTAATPATRADSVVCLCPNKKCGGIMEQKDRFDLNLCGRWLHESEDGQSAVPLGHEDIRRSRRVSYWMKAPVAALANWSALIERLETARDALKKLGDETQLKTVWNVDLGLPYLPQARLLVDDLSKKELKSRADDRPLGVVPKQARFLTVTVDGQKTSFEVLVTAYGRDMENWIVDRYSIAIPPNGSKKRSLRPDLYLEDWDAILPLMHKAYPVEGVGHLLKPALLAIDRNGYPGYTPNAYAWWRKLRKNGKSTGIHLIHGEPEKIYSIDGDIIGKDIRAMIAPAQKPNRQYATVARDIPIIKAYSNVMKDEVCASLLRDEPGPMTCHLPAALDDRYFDEFCAETRTDKGWVKRNKGSANECFDLIYYSKALTIVGGVERWDWDNPPAWGKAGAENSNAVLPEGKEVDPVARSGGHEKTNLSWAKRMAALAKKGQS